MNHGKKGLGMRIIFFLMLCGCALAGCGKGAQEQQPEYYEVSSSLHALFKAQDDRTDNLLGMQYYQGEPVQLWAENGDTVYLARKDGSREPVLENAGNARAMEWFLDAGGGVYCWKRDWALGAGESSVLRKLNPSGEELHSWALEEKMTPQDICQLQDGSIVLLLRDERDGSGRLGTAEPDKDTVSVLKGIRLNPARHSRHITAGEKGLLVLESDVYEGIMEIDMTDGSRLKTIAYSGRYRKDAPAELEGLEIGDFLLSDQGDIQILWAEPLNGECIGEKLLLTRVEKEVIRLRAFSADVLRKMIVGFNLSDSEYMIVIEELPPGTSRQDYATQTSVQLAAGTGPDILEGDLLQWDCFRGMTEKGMFEDLAPLLEQSGVKEEDYFPFAFQYWRDGEKIYTVCATGFPYCYYVDSSLVEGAQEPDVKTLVEALLSYPGEAHFEYLSAYQILTFFLNGSENFWGMIDWEQKTCDFDNELFQGILEISRRYSLGKISSIPEQPSLVGSLSWDNLYYFDSSQEMAKQGRAMAGVQFDDGCHAAISIMSQIAVVHGASAKKLEGVRRFLAYILREDTQMTIRNEESGSWLGVPSNKAALASIIKMDLAWMAETGNTKSAFSTLGFPSGEEIILKNKEYTREDITEERIAEYMAMLEDTRFLPTATKPLLEIIYEETQYYFNGAKSFEETAEIINNRVSLYIKENSNGHGSSQRQK